MEIGSEEWVIVSYYYPAFTGNYKEGKIVVYGTFADALQRCKDLLKTKEKPYEWKYAICKVEGIVFVGEPEVELVNLP